MGSYNAGKAEVSIWIWKAFPKDATVLDVGACNGVWRQLIPGYVMDAVEIFTPNAEALTGYRRVINKDISDVTYEWYDLIIFGDVIEHMTVEKAKAVLEYAWPRCRDMIVAVPFEYVQGELYGNPWERHIQDDLTPELFAERYPGFEVLYDPGNRYCYYHKGENHERDQTL